MQRYAAANRCSFLFPCELGDPVSCIQINSHGCMAATVLGKVWLQSSGSPKVETLTEFSDEAVRGLHLDEELGYAVFGDACKGWQRAAPHTPTYYACFRGLDKKNVQNVRYVLQRDSWACLLFPIATMVVNVAHQEFYHRQFKLLDYGGANSASDIAPCDFDGERLVVADRTTHGTSVFRVVHLERNDVEELDDMPGNGNTISLVKLWGTSCIVCVIGCTPFVYHYGDRSILRTLRGHRCEVVAVDAHLPQRIATMSSDAVVHLWTGSTGECSHTLHIPEANFYLDYPYCLATYENKVLASADEGVFLLELGDE